MDMSLYYAPEKPPTAGLMKTGEDARRHLAAYDEYRMRLPLERKPIEFYLTLHKDTVRDLQNRIVLRELGPVKGDEDEEDDEAEESDGEEDDVKDDHPASSVPALVTPAPDLRLERMRAALGELSLRREMRTQFGPRSIQDSLVILRKIQMSDRPFAYQGNGSAYNEEWNIQLKWIGKKRSVKNPEGVRPFEPSLIEVFLAGVKPATFRERLKEEYHAKLVTLRSSFLQSFNDYFENLRCAAELGSVNVGVTYSRDDTDRRPTGSRGNLGPSSGPELKSQRSGHQGQSVRSVPAPAGPTVSAGVGLCHLCNKPGHYKNICPLRRLETPPPQASPVRPQNLQNAYGAGSTPQRGNSADRVKFTSPVVSGKASPPKYPTQSGANGGHRTSPTGGKNYTPGGKVNGAIRRPDVEEKRAVLAARVGNVRDVPTIVVRILIDTGSDANIIPAAWLPTLRAEGVVVQRIDGVEIRWTMNRAGVTMDQVVSLRVDFIGWANAPVNYIETFFVSDSDFDWITLGRASIFRIRLSDDLRLVVAAQTALGVMLSNGDLETDPRFKDMDGNWVDSVDPLALGDVHEVKDVSSAESLLASVYKITESESTFCLPREKESHLEEHRQPLRLKETDWSSPASLKRSSCVSNDNRLKIKRSMNAQTPKSAFSSGDKGQSVSAPTVDSEWEKWPASAFKEEPKEMKAAPPSEDKWEEWTEGNDDDRIILDNSPSFDLYEVNEIKQPNGLDEIIGVRSSELEESSDDPEVYDYLNHWSRGDLPHICRCVTESANGYKREKADLGWSHDMYNDFDIRKLPVPAPSEPMVPWWYNELRMSSGNISDTVVDADTFVDRVLCGVEVEQESTSEVEQKSSLMVDYGSDTLDEPWIIAALEQQAKRQKLIEGGLLNPDDDSDEGVDIVVCDPHDEDTEIRSNMQDMSHNELQSEDQDPMVAGGFYQPLIDIMSGGEDLDDALNVYNSQFNRDFAPYRSFALRQQQQLEAEPNSITYFDAEIRRVRDLIDEALQEAACFMVFVDGWALRITNVSFSEVFFSFHRNNGDDLDEVRVRVELGPFRPSVNEPLQREADASLILEDFEDPHSVDAIWRERRLETGLMTYGYPIDYAHNPPMVVRERTCRGGGTERRNVRIDACEHCWIYGLALTYGRCALCIQLPFWYEFAWGENQDTGIDIDVIWLLRELERLAETQSKARALDEDCVPIPWRRFDEDPDDSSASGQGNGYTKIVAPMFKDAHESRVVAGKPNRGGKSSNSGDASGGRARNITSDFEDVIQHEGLRSMEQFLVESGVFVDELPPGGSNLPHMRIEFREDFVLPSTASFRQYGERALAALLTEVQSQVSKGIIEECSDRPTLSVVMVRKTDSPSGYRFCIDARPINAGTVTQPYNPPTVDQVLRSMDRKPFKARFDMITSYWQVFIAEEDRHKTAFRVGNKVYRYIRMAMGLVQASSHLQGCLCRLFGDHIGHDMSIYVDDILMYCSTLEELRTLVRLVTLRLKEQFIYLKRKKCVIGASELTVLGHVVGPDFIRMAQSRIDEVANLPFPKNPKELRSSLGQLGFQRSYVPHFSELAAPLTGLVNGTTAAMQTPEAKAAWKALLRAVADQCQLRFLDYNESIVVRVDASVLGVGAALLNVSLVEGEKRERLIAVTSHAFTKAERLWKTIEQECFAVVVALRCWYGLLWGQCFVVEGDHLNLAYIHQGSSPKIVRWDLFLQGFCYFYRHIPGETNVIPDGLSRQDFDGNHRLLADMDTFDVEHQIADIVTEAPSNSAVVKLVRAFTRSAKPAANAVEIKTPDRVVLKVLDLTGNLVGQREAFEKVHNAMVGHHGINRTVRALYQSGVRWEKMSRDVTALVNECAVCQKERARVVATGETRTSLRQYSLFEEVSIDFIGPLPEDALNNKYICELICGFSNFVELFAVEAATAAVAAHVLINIVGRYGAPARIRSDRGTHFVNELIEELVKMLDMVHIITPPYRPQANGMIERSGKETGRHLRAIARIPQVRSIWSVVIPLVMKVVNSTFRDYLGCCPNDLVYLVPPMVDRGFEGVFEPQRMVSELLPVSTEFMEMLVAAHEAMLDQASLMIMRHQNNAADQVVSERNFQVGDLVLLSYPTAPPSKLHARVAGPFRVTVINRNLVTVQDITGSRVLQRDISMVIPFRTSKGVTESQLVEVAASDLGESVVVSISGVRGNSSKKQLLEFEVHWEDGEVSWEPYSAVSKLELLDEFLAKSPDAKLRRMVSKPK